MPALLRSISIRGPHFYQVDDVLMFVHHIDNSTQVGPRPANAEDKRNHPDAYTAFETRDPPVPFKPLVSFSTPEGAGPAPHEESEPTRRRREAHARGEGA